MFHKLCFYEYIISLSRLLSTSSLKVSFEAQECPKPITLTRKKALTPRLVFFLLEKIRTTTARISFHVRST